MPHRLVLPLFALLLVGLTLDRSLAQDRRDADSRRLLRRRPAVAAPFGRDARPAEADPFGGESSPGELRDPRIDAPKPKTSADRPDDDPAKSKMVSVKLTLVQFLEQGESATAELRMANLTGPSEDVARRLAELDRVGAVLISNTILLTTMSEQRCTVQCGERTAIVTGQQMTRQGVAKSYQHENTGVMASLTPRVQGNRIGLKVDFERSWIRPAEPAEESDAETPIPSSMSTLVCQSSLVVNSDETVVTARMTTNTSEDWVLLVSAKVLSPSDSQ